MYTVRHIGLTDEGFFAALLATNLGITRVLLNDQGGRLYRVVGSVKKVGNMQLTCSMASMDLLICNLSL